MMKFKVEDLYEGRWTNDQFGGIGNIVANNAGNLQIAQGQVAVGEIVPGAAVGAVGVGAQMVQQPHFAGQVNE